MSKQVVSISELHRLTGLDRQTLGKMLKPLTAAGEGAKNARTYYLEDCLTVIVDYVKARNEESPKARKEAADADKAEINVARLRGDLIPVDMVRSSAADLVKSLFQRCVNLAPRLVADRVAGKTDRADVEIAIREHYSDIFNELRSLPNNFLSIPDVAADSDGQSETL